MAGGGSSKKQEQRKRVGPGIKASVAQSGSRVSKAAGSLGSSTMHVDQSGSRSAKKAGAASVSASKKTPRAQGRAGRQIVKTQEHYALVALHLPLLLLPGQGMSASLIGCVAPGMVWNPITSSACSALYCCCSRCCCWASSPSFALLSSSLPLPDFSIPFSAGHPTCWLLA